MALKKEKTPMEELLATLEKKHGVDRVTDTSCEVVTTGSIALDEAIGIGGTPVGKLIELQGMESTGKSTICLHQIAEYQKAYPEKRVGYFDFENSYDKRYAEAIGVDSDKLLIYQPESQEEGYNLILDLIRNNICSAVVIDSQTAAIPKKIIDGDMEDATMALQARLNSKFFGKVKGMLGEFNCTLFVISQFRKNISGYGLSDVTTGGEALKFYADLRIKISKIIDKDNDRNKTKIDIIKNKMAAPFGVAEINIIWGEGFDVRGEILEYACRFGHVTKKGGGHYFIDDVKIAHGESKMLEYLKDDTNYIGIKESVLESLRLVKENSSGKETESLETLEE